MRVIRKPSCVFRVENETGEILADDGMGLLLGIAELVDIDGSFDPRTAATIDPRGFTEVPSLELADALEAAAKWIRGWAK